MNITICLDCPIKFDYMIILFLLNHSAVLWLLRIGQRETIFRQVCSHPLIQNDWNNNEKDL